MQKTKLGHLQFVYGKKAGLILALLVCGQLIFAQEKIQNLPSHDQKPYYFGIVLGYNSSHYNVTHHPDFLASDTIMTVNSLNSGRIHLGIQATWQVNERIDVRFYPLNLIFSEKKFKYTQTIPNPGDNQLEYIKKVESIVMSFPLQVRLKSDRINNFRVYSLAGFKYDFDLASNAGARNAEEIVKVKKGDFGIEAGVGFQFFFKYFILSPEIKISQGLSNVHVRDQSLKYSNVIDQMKSRMILFSLHFEGGGIL